MAQTILIRKCQAIKKKNIQNYRKFARLNQEVKSLHVQLLWNLGSSGQGHWHSQGYFELMQLHSPILAGKLQSFEGLFKIMAHLKNSATKKPRILTLGNKLQSKGG